MTKRQEGILISLVWIFLWTFGLMVEGFLQVNFNERGPNDYRSEQVFSIFLIIFAIRISGRDISRRSYIGKMTAAAAGCCMAMFPMMLFASLGETSPPVAGIIMLLGSGYGVWVGRIHFDRIGNSSNEH